MNDADLEQACLEIIGAGMQGRKASEHADAIAPHVVKQMAALAQTRASLFAEARLEPEDVAQEVLRRLIMSPPSNPNRHHPVAVVFGWTRAVALRFLIDRKRRVRLETPPRTDDDGNALETPSLDRAPDEEIVTRTEVARMRDIAKGLAAYKHLWETFQVLVGEPDIPALELANRIGIVPKSASVAETKAATAHAWKLKQRVLDFLADRMGADRREKKR